MGEEGVRTHALITCFFSMAVSFLIAVVAKLKKHILLPSHHVEKVWSENSFQAVSALRETKL